MRERFSILLVVVGLTVLPAFGELPPVPVPAENPITEPKRVLGKILFWDEQLSSDNTVACGTCHRPGAGGGDPRAGVFPGKLPGSIDDVAGSPGIRRLDADGMPVEDPVFGDLPRVTSRVAPTIFGALWADELFWDGRAPGRLVDPDTGLIAIERGAALENQILETLNNPAEMAKADRRWDELTTTLAAVEPLALADRWPADMTAAVARHASYPELFEAAFGDETISATRIAMAIATYERTLVADQTPWDRFQAGDESALGAIERIGWRSFQTLRCTSCHAPPLFTTNGFANIGLRRTEHDPGRIAQTGLGTDAGDMKIPSLRNVGLRHRLMHTGEFKVLGEAIGFYRDPSGLPDIDEMPDGGPYTFSMTQQTAGYLIAFLANALTDPRVASESFPFDRPRLASERSDTPAQMR
jgi:cytochrome c peroxidase